MKTKLVTMTGRNIRQVDQDLQQIRADGCYDLPVDAILALCANAGIFREEWRRYDNALDVVQKRHGTGSAPYIEEVLDAETTISVCTFDADLSECHVPVFAAQTIMLFKEENEV